MTEIRPHTLPTLSLDYHAGTLTNTLTGETAAAVFGVILGSRTDRVLWPTHGESPRLPLCVNGSEFGPCNCAFADWGADGTPPDCSEELSVLIWDETHAQAVVLTARKSQVKTLDRYLEMKALTSGHLHDQHVTVAMKREGTLHRLVLMPGLFVAPDVLERMAAIAGRMAATGAFEGLG